MIPVLGFLPDADPTTPGALVDCVNVVPTERGMASAPALATAVTGLAALAGECRGSAVLLNTAGTRRHFAGTQTKLYELTGTTWTDVSKAGDYTGSTENRWQFGQFGNAALASNDTEPIQATTSGAFASIASAPIAKIMFTMDNFVLAMNVIHAPSYGDQADGWHCSAFQDHTSWTQNVATQCASGRLIGEGGELTAGGRLGPYAIAYKAQSIFVGQYVAGDIVWQWDRIPGDVGCLGVEAWADVGGAHVFVGEDNIWMFDGTRPVPIATGQVRQWFFDNSSATYRYRTIVKYDKQNSRVWFFYPSASSSTGQPDRAIVYHLNSRKWGRSDQTVQAVVQFVTPGLTWDTLNTVAATWDSLPSIPWDSQAWQAGGKALAVFDASNNLKTLTGTASGGSVTLWHMGDDDAVTVLRGLRARFTQSPQTATASGSAAFNEGEPFVVRSAGNIFDGKFPLRQSGRFHQVSLTMTGPFEVVAARPDLVAAGWR
jgi:hypothetical protein